MSIRSKMNLARESQVRRLLRINFPDLSASDLNSQIAEMYSQYLDKLIVELEKQIEHQLLAAKAESN